MGSVSASFEQLTFAWWNLHNFAHFDTQKTVSARWPKTLEDYQARLDRIASVCHGLTEGGPPDLLAVCEVTRTAAHDLAARLPHGYKVADSTAISREDDFQVAIIYRTGFGFEPTLPLLATETEDVSRETRPMLTMGLSLPNDFVWIIACHWTGMRERSSQTARSRLANFLRGRLYEFLYPERPTSQHVRHAMVLGDLNEEPTAELFESGLEASRDRWSSRKPPHWRDSDVRRVRLYNLSWRYLGEQVPHGTTRPIPQGPAGTWFGESEGWRTLDHVIVSGSLIGEKPPYVDEANTRIVSLPLLVDDRGRPIAYDPELPTGLSDHLPIVGRIVLPSNKP